MYILLYYYWGIYLINCKYTDIIQTGNVQAGWQASKLKLNCIITILHFGVLWDYVLSSQNVRVLKYGHESSKIKQSRQAI